MKKLKLKNGLLVKPDFRKRFAHPPKGPMIKGGLVELILEEREAS